MTDTVRWGVIGPGGIATGFAEAMQLVDDGTIVAVASRSAERADAFGDRFDIARRYDSYEAIADDPEVDAVYVATPHSRHAADTLMCLEAGKHVLCEKPLALNAGQVSPWWRRPATGGCSSWKRSGAASSPRTSRWEMSSRRGGSGSRSWWRPTSASAGRSIPRTGCSTPRSAAAGCSISGSTRSSCARSCSARPDDIAAEGVLGDTGVDELVAAVLHHPAGSIGVIKAALRANLSCTARISGSDGAILIPALMHCPTSITVVTRGGEEQIDGSYEGNGLRYEIAEVHRCLAAGLTESPTIPLDETIRLAQTMDLIRQQIGLVYPGEPAGLAPPG